MYKIITALCLLICCSTAQAAPMVGTEGTVKPKLIALCVSQDAYDNWIKASVANDRDGMIELVLIQQCFFAEKVK